MDVILQRAVSLYDVHGGKIADTPGFSSLGAVDNAEDLVTFSEIRQLVMAVNSVVLIPMVLVLMIRMRLKMARNMAVPL